MLLLPSCCPAAGATAAAGACLCSQVPLFTSGLMLTIHPNRVLAQVQPSNWCSGSYCSDKSWYEMQG